MARAFNLADLQPEPLELTDTDGQIYQLRPAADFGANELVRLQHILHQVQRAQAKAATGQDEQTLVEAATALSQQLTAFVQLVAPTMAAERAAAMPTNMQLAILTWWKEEQPEVFGPKKAQATSPETKATPAIPSPDSR